MEVSLLLKKFGQAGRAQGGQKLWRHWLLFVVGSGRTVVLGLAEHGAAVVERHAADPDRGRQNGRQRGERHAQHQEKEVDLCRSMPAISLAGKEAL